METNIFYQNNFGPCQHSHHKWLHLRKALSMLKDETQKRNTSKTPLDRNYWHFPCVMLCTLPFVVQLQYILQYVKHLKCESGNNLTNHDKFDDDDNNKTAVPFLLHVLTCTTFSTRVFIECPRPEFGNTFQERLLASQENVT